MGASSKRRGAARRAPASLSLGVYRRRRVPRQWLYYTVRCTHTVLQVATPSAEAVTLALRSYSWRPRLRRDGLGFDDGLCRAASLHSGGAGISTSISSIGTQRRLAAHGRGRPQTFLPPQVYLRLYLGLYLHYAYAYIILIPSCQASKGSSPQPPSALSSPPSWRPAHTIV